MNTIVIVERADLPAICAVCGKSGENRIGIRVHNSHKIKRQFFSEYIAPLFGGLIGKAVEDEVFDNRPMNLRLPVCGEHNNKKSIRGVRTQALKGRRRVKIFGLHARFVHEFEKIQSEKWDFISEQVDTDDGA